MGTSLNYLSCVIDVDVIKALVAKEALLVANDVDFCLVVVEFDYARVQQMI